MAKRTLMSGDKVYVTLVTEWDDNSADPALMGFVMLPGTEGRLVSVGIPRGAAVAPQDPNVSYNGNFLQDERIRMDAARRLRQAEEVGDAGELGQPGLRAEARPCVTLQEGNVLFTAEGRFQVVGGELVGEGQGAGPLDGDEGRFLQHHEALATPKSETVLEEAGHLIYGPRMAEYGTEKLGGFETVAEMWSSFLGFEVKAEQVPIMLVLLKVARSTEDFRADRPVKRDTIVDMAGYAGCVEKVQDLRTERESQ